jgi:hypothetical protein
MANRDITRLLFTKRRKAINLHKNLRQNQQYRQKVEKSYKEAIRRIEDEEAFAEIEDHDLYSV